MGNDWKDRLGVVFSTQPDFDYQNTKETTESDTLPKERQRLRVYTDKHNRRGKTVTLVDGFIGKSEDLKVLEKCLKTKCGTGGSSKDGQVIIQGNLPEKVKEILRSEGYRVK